jgi:hypothetical protein
MVHDEILPVHILGGGSSFLWAVGLKVLKE